MMQKSMFTIDGIEAMFEGYTDGSQLLAYLQEEYYWLNYKQLYEVYYGILQQIDGYMSDEHVKIFADGLSNIRRKIK